VQEKIEYCKIIIFNNETEFQNHLDFIKNEDKKLDFENRTCEVRNWLNYIKIN